MARVRVEREGLMPPAAPPTWLYGSRAALLRHLPAPGIAGVLCNDGEVPGVRCIRCVTLFPDRSAWPDWGSPLRLPPGAWADIEDYAGYGRLPDGSRPSSFWSFPDWRIPQRARELPAGGLLLPWSGAGYFPLRQYGPGRQFVRAFYRSHPQAVLVTEEAIYPAPPTPEQFRAILRAERHELRPGAVWAFVPATSGPLWEAAGAADARVVMAQ